MDDCHTISRRRSPSTTKENRRENSFPITYDLMLEIYSRLPAKSVARCRCLSKLWSSTLSLPYFTDLFLTRASTRPHLLFVCRKDGELFFFSSPQLQNPDESCSSPQVTASFHMKLSFGFPLEMFSPVKGLVFRRDEQVLMGLMDGQPSVLYNPTTKQSFTLPRMNTKLNIKEKSFLGYDRMEKQHKVLSITWPYAGNCIQPRVLTLGTLKLSWRLIECCVPHLPTLSGNGICINGVLYYLASVHNSSSLTYMIVCFDFTTEKFRFMNAEESFSRAVDVTATLINYNGKLGSLRSEESFLVRGTSESIELWVLEDPEKHEWSKRVHVLPPLWKNVVSESVLLFVGMIGTNVIVLADPWSASNPFYVYHYNVERNTVVRVEIEGIDVFKYDCVITFLDHVENLKLIQA